MPIELLSVHSQFFDIGPDLLLVAQSLSSSFRSRAISANISRFLRNALLGILLSIAFAPALAPLPARNLEILNDLLPAFFAPNKNLEANCLLLEGIV